MQEDDAALPSRSWTNRAATVGFVTLAFFAVAILLLKPGSRSHVAAPRNQCINNLRQLTVSFHSYESTHGHFPRPFTTDAQGTPLHSWRTTILPDIEQIALDRKIDRSKAWHHPDNLKLSSATPWPYHCPSAPEENRKNSVTSYVAIIGPRTMWPREGKRVMSDVVDGLSNTISALETNLYPLHWMSTADPGIESIGPINSAGDSLLSHGFHRGGIVISRPDASTEFLPEDTDLDVFREMLIIDDGTGNSGLGTP